MKTFYHLGMIAVLLAGLLLTATPAYAAGTITVNSTEDTITNNGNCDLREALQAADSDTAVDLCAAGLGTDTIQFNIPGAGVHTITLTGSLSVSTPVIIDGTSQPGYSGTPLIRLDGDNNGSQQFSFNSGSDGSSLKGLMFTNATWNAVMVNPGVTNMTFAANYFNTDGNAQLPTGSNAAGVLLFKTDHITVGGSTAADRNLFSGNEGVQIEGSSNNLVEGNYFGVRADGLTPITNQTVNSGAIFIETNSLVPANNTIRNNVITSFSTGIDLEQQVNHTIIAGNTIGVGKDGSTQLGNSYGIMLSGSSDNTIGGANPADRNVVSGNTYSNIEIQHTVSYTSDNNLIFGNYIGTDAAGMTAVGSTPKGINLAGGDGNQIGDSASGVGNLIAGNTYQIEIQNATNALIQNNRLGVNINGTSGIGTPSTGVWLHGASARITNNWIANDSNYSVLLDVTSIINGISSGNCFTNNGAFGLTNVNAAVAHFSGSWWGDPSGPTDSANPGGTGDKVSQASGNIDYSGFLTSAPAICASVAQTDVPALSFGNQPVGSTSALQSVTLTNTGAKQMSISSISTAPPYSIAGTSTCPTAGGTLSAGATCSIQVKFAPSAAGSAPGSITITSDASNSPTSVSLSGTGVSPAIGLDSTSLSFGNQLVGTSALQTVHLTNTGSASMVFTSLTTAAPYSIDATSTCPLGSGTLAAGLSCTINVKFSPTTTLTSPGSVSITTNTATSPDSITLSGTGVTGTQLLKNASFESDANQDKKPDNWTYANFNLLTDKRDCTVRSAGKCSLMLAGNGKAKTVSQTIIKSGIAGDDFAFSLFSKAIKVPAAAAYRLTVSFFNGASLVGTQSLNFAAGTHGFKQAKGTFTAPGAYTKIIYKITFKAASGTAWFDAASLTWAP